MNDPNMKGTVWISSVWTNVNMFWENNAKIIDYHDKKNSDQSECLGKEMLISKKNLREEIEHPIFCIYEVAGALVIWESTEV